MSNIIITGANQGIGYYMAEKLLADGNNVSVMDIETFGLEKLKERYDNLTYYKVDLRNYEKRLIHRLFTFFFKIENRRNNLSQIIKCR